MTEYVNRDETGTSKQTSIRRLLFTISICVPIMLCIFAFSPRPRAQNTKHLSFVVAFTQQGAPVHIESVTHTLEFLYGSAKVENVSDRTIRSVTFGVLLHEIGPAWAKPVLAANRQIATNLNPGDTRTLEIDDLPLGDAQRNAAELNSNSVIVEFGILSVEFADGTTWSFDWRGQGAFNPKNMWRGGQMSELIRPVPGCGPSKAKMALTKLAGLLPGMSHVLAQSGYTCGASVASQFCTNKVSSCTDTLCPKGKPSLFKSAIFSEN